LGGKSQVFWEKTTDFATFFNFKFNNIYLNIAQCIETFTFFTGYKWGGNDLRWRLDDDQYTQDLSKANVDRDIEAAFKIWSDVTPLTFERVYKPDLADIIIRFASGSHGDGQPFDSSGGTLAHAFYPYQPTGQGADDLSGDTHLDDAEKWTIDTNAGTNLLQVTVHEFGHALGLDHSNVRDAIMFAYYRGYIENFKLPSDDIMTIQKVYGSEYKI
jgi:predicted Zn-dependent protease